MSTLDLKALKATKDRATVTEHSERVETLIQGVVVRRATTHVDERGELSEMYNAAWEGIDPAAVKYVYTAMVRPGRVKGWVYHKLQSDRIYSISGHLKYVIWDTRKGSPTHGMINEVFISERNRGLLVIPPLVVHAVQNIGDVDAVFVNMPTMPYNHANPDKYRVPFKSVPYSFDKGIGW
jgi:dTDP-4-dehydrorhamnose 3,5-epimerase